MDRYSVHYEHRGQRAGPRHVPLGSIRYVFITVNHDHSPEVKANGKIRKECRPVLPQYGKDRDLKLCYVEEFDQHSTVIKRSMGLWFMERVSYRHITCLRDVKALQAAAGGRVDASNLPIRLIDIQGTLDVEAHGGVCFIQPTDWSFHVLSHTWSSACRAFSKSIGEKVHRAADYKRSIGEKVDSAADYNKAFKEAKLHQGDENAVACYHGLLDFLRLLKEEGVKAIWFDALCINQRDDSGEKDREISRLGAYYGCSLGCYVSAHGIGQGFKLWTEDGDWPRWFERVWTLQEFLLPRKVTFIVEGLASRTIQYVNHFIRKGGVPGLCECALPPRNMFFRGSLEEIDADGGQEKDEILCSSQGKLQIPCDTCRCAEFIRKCHQQPGVYFVDREAYYFLCELDISRGPVSWLEIPYHWNLFALAHKPCPAGIGKVVQMLRRRECTNEEDRVLGVLGLLQQLGQAYQKIQLRSGMKLHEQLLKLHDYCGVDVFFKLCLIEPKAFQMKGMSWAPCLERSNDEICQPVPFGEWETCSCLHPSARMLNVSSRGLKLYAPVACGKLIPRGQSMLCMKPGRHSGFLLNFSDHNKSKFEKFSQPMWTEMRPTDGEDMCYSCYVHRSNNCTHWIRECDLEVGESHTFPLKAHSRDGCTGTHMVIQDSWVGTCSMRGHPHGRHTRSAEFVMSFSGFSIHALKGFPVWLVLFGMAHTGSWRDQWMVGMVCIANDDQGSEFHKIGIFACHKAHPIDDLFFRDVPPRICLIGGFDANANPVASYVSQ